VLVLAALAGVVAVMSSSASRRTVVVVLLLVVAAINCYQLEAVDHLPVLLQPDTKALALAVRRQLPTDDKRGWRKNRMRVWGKRSAVDDDDDDHDDDASKRSWGKNTVRVWGKRHGAVTADRRAWAGNTIRVWGKRHSVGLTPEQMMDVAFARYSAAPKRSSSVSEARMPTLNDGGQRTPTRLPAESVVDVGTLADDDLIGTRSKRSPERQHVRRSLVRRAVSHRPRWVAFRGPKRSWRTNVIRIWGKRAL